MSKRYTPISDGEWVQPIRKGHRLRCCDCGLVHNMDFRIYRGQIQFRPVRNRRATAAVRRTIKVPRTNP